jgi:hypothetical protein
MSIPADKMRLTFLLLVLDGKDWVFQDGHFRFTTTGALKEEITRSCPMDPETVGFGDDGIQHAPDRYEKWRANAEQFWAALEFCNIFPELVGGLYYLSPQAVLLLPAPETRNPKPETRNPRPETQNPKPVIRDPRPETRDPKPETRNPRPETRNPKPAGRHGAGHGGEVHQGLESHLRGPRDQAGTTGGGNGLRPDTPTRDLYIPTVVLGGVAMRVNSAGKMGGGFRWEA